MIAEPLRVNTSPYNESDWTTAKTYLEAELKDKHRTSDTIAATRMTMQRKFMASPVWAIRNFFYTVDKRTKLDVLCDPFLGQTMLDCAIEQQRKAQLPQRILEIKPRQVGWTTWNMARGLWASLHHNTNALLVIDDQRVVEETMLKATAMLSNLPPWLTPDIRIQNLKQMVFDQPNPKLRTIKPGLNSTFVVTVPAELRGVRPPNVAILSELAHYDDPENVLGALSSGIGMHENTCIVIDTTPRGYDNFYYPMVGDVVKRNPTLRKFWERNTIPSREEIINFYPEADEPRDYIPLFCPWFWHIAYTTKDEHPDAHYPKMRQQDWDWMRDTVGDLKEYGDAEETMLMERFGVTIPKLFWRRKTIDGYITRGADWRRRLLIFRQEFASTWEGCFVDFGDAPFDAACLDVLRTMTREPAYEGLFGQAEFDASKSVYLEKKHDVWQSVRLYKNIQKDHKYIIAVDCANTFENAKADATVAQLIDRDTLDQCIVYEARVPQYKLKVQLDRMYRYVKQGSGSEPLLAIETAGIGFSLVRDLMDMGCTNQYRYKRFDTDILDPDSKWLGWETNFRTRPIMDDALKEAVGHYDRAGEPDPLVKIYDKRTFLEMMSLAQYGEDGMKAKGKNHDDHPIALAIALAARKDSTHGARQSKPPDRTRPKNALYGHLAKRASRVKKKNHPDLKEL